MKKYSCYNRIFYAGDNIVLYNSASDGILMLLPEIEDLLQTHEENPEGLIDFHEELYQSMLDKQMIVDKDADEYEQVIAQWRQNDTDEKTFSITINPTMDCNLRCWYCYEEHTKGSKMTPDLIESVKNLLQKRATETPLEQLHLSFFGGEPLLYFDDTVLPILEQAKEL
ncbi:MAG: 4Fe-4S cluster-binding domain-containing protein, partial [Tannerellaceae bacterium]